MRSGYGSDTIPERRISDLERQIRSLKQDVAALLAGGASFSVGGTTTGAAGSSASVSLTETSPDVYEFDFTIPRGDTGATGATGSRGAPGGGVTARYIFSPDTTSTPSAGYVQFNAATTSATAIYFHTTTADGVAFGPVLSTFDDSTSTLKGFIRFSAEEDPTKWAIFSISALSSASSWRTMTVARVGSGGTFADGDVLVMSFTRTGDKGATGPAGSIGAVSGAFTLTASATSTIVTDSNVTATSRIFVVPSDSGGWGIDGALDGITPAAGSFTVSHSSSTTTRSYFYLVINP